MHSLLKLFNDKKDHYQGKELGDGTQDFTRRVLEEIFGLTPKPTLVPESSLFGEVLYDQFYSYEGSRKSGDKARWDFKCKINGKIVVVEAEKYMNIGAGMKQIAGYMIAENTNYGIVTDGHERRFFKDGPDKIDIYEVKTLEDLCESHGQGFLENYYNTYEYYLQRIKTVQEKPFELKIFHEGLIATAGRLVSDFRSIELFTGESKEKEKEEIQTAYSLIIQLLLIKIIQDKKKIDILKKDEVIYALDNQNYVGVFEAVEKQIMWLGEFYTPYHNEQDGLFSTIINHYKKESRFTKLTLDSVRVFLDVFAFIFSFNLKQVSQDIFGAVYENYLKELYKDDEVKKGQVFTPSEIVIFMLDEIGYTEKYIQSVIEENLSGLLQNLDTKGYNIQGLSIIDPACGSGTFLYKAANRIVNAVFQIRKNNKINDLQAGKLCELLICNNIVGFDIEPFPLYLAEMNILQSLLFFNVASDGEVLNKIDEGVKIFSTNDSIAEFHNLEESMKNDLLDISTRKELFAKRDNIAILKIKSDIQDYNADNILEAIKLEKGLQEIQKPIYALSDNTLLNKTIKTFYDKFKKQIDAFSSYKALKKFIKTKDEGICKKFDDAVSKYNADFKKIEIELYNIVQKNSAKRTKFDFVIGNPPYIGLNDIPQDIKANWKSKNISMGNVYGVNLHSTPINPKRYSPKPNLYSYFNALGYFLLKEGGKLSFIVPEGFINYDCNCYFLAKQVNLEEVYFFNHKLFINRGLLGNYEVPTSAIVYKYSKKETENKSSIYSFNAKLFIESNNIKSKDISLDDIKENLSKKTVTGDEISNLISDGFSILKYQKEELRIINQYKEKSDSFEVYYIHDNSQKPVKDNFYVDGGLKISENQILIDNKEGDKVNLFDNVLGNSKNYYISKPINSRYVDINDNFEIIQGSQGKIIFTDGKYKILRRTKNMLNFKFTDWDFVLNNNQNLIISSNNYTEIMYLFGLLNSNTIKHIFALYQLEGEKDFLVSISFMKQKFRVPKIDSTVKEKLKTQLIENSEKIINLCKNGASTMTTRGDICDTTLNSDSMKEIITGLKLEFASKKIVIPQDTIATEPLPNDILELVGANNSGLKQLEDERDSIVEKLYELKQ